MEIKFTVPGKPQGKGRPRFTRGGHPYTPQATRDYEKAVANAWRAAGAQKMPEGAQILCIIHAVFPIPKSYTKKRKAQLDKHFHTLKPDLDNIEKAILDALNGLAFDDDSAVCSLYAEKYWAADSDGYVQVILREAIG